MRSAPRGRAWKLLHHRGRRGLHRRGKRLEGVRGVLVTGQGAQVLLGDAVWVLRQELPTDVGDPVATPARTLSRTRQRANRTAPSCRGSPTAPAPRGSGSRAARRVTPRRSAAASTIGRCGAPRHRTAPAGRAPCTDPMSEQTGHQRVPPEGARLERQEELRAALSPRPDSCAMAIGLSNPRSERSLQASGAARGTECSAYALQSDLVGMSRLDLRLNPGCARSRAPEIGQQVGAGRSGLGVDSRRPCVSAPSRASDHCCRTDSGAAYSSGCRRTHGRSSDTWPPMLRVGSTKSLMTIARRRCPR